MKRKKVRNPLLKRIKRELIGDWRKYLVVSLFLILTIGFVSGMYVANGSMLQASDESALKYKLENGHFELDKKADKTLIDEIESGKTSDLENLLDSKDLDFEKVPVKVYESFYRNEEEDNDNDGKADGTIRVYAKNDDINNACIMDGKLPESSDEIAIDRMHADNAGLKVGDKITVGNKKFEITGLIAYVNYSTLHEKNTDLVFDALKFDVAMVTDEGFDSLDKSIHYCYAWSYENSPKDETEEKEISDDFMKYLAIRTMMNQNEIKDYVPRYANSAVNFATDDMGSDEAMGGVLLDILIVIIAFIFAVTISNTIVKESSVIGTLRASGYTKTELLVHYLSMPVIVTLISAAVGNILGYTLFKKVVVDMYYNSYSLPTYETIWNPSAFFKTTLIPVVLMFVVNLVIILKMIQHTPLQFLRHDLKKNKRKKAVRIPRWSFMNRFRLRIIFQNVPNYLILLLGISFIMILLAMAIGMPSTLKYYQDNAKNMMIAKYQYVLKSCEDEQGKVIETDNENAEKFSMRSLQKKNDNLIEEVSVYGVSDDSEYIQIDGLSSNKQREVYITEAFSQKYNLKTGDTVSLDEKYEDKKYEFKVVGIYDKCQTIAVFMPLDNYREVFDLKEDVFTGYMSSDEIKDIDEKYVATVIGEKDITKMCDQLNHSMGSYMTYFQVLCVLLAAVLIYLLTKIIIEKNENSISMTKILGYYNNEIAGLYLMSTTIMVVIFDIIGTVVGTLIMKTAWRVILSTYSGWFSFYMEPVGYVKMFAFVMLGYLFVMFFDFKRIKKIPMDEALKNVE